MQPNDPRHGQCSTGLHPFCFRSFWSPSVRPEPRTHPSPSRSQGYILKQVRGAVSRPSLSKPTNEAPPQVLSNVTLTLRQLVNQPRCATPSYTMTSRCLLLPWTCQVAYEWVRSLALSAPTSPSDFQRGYPLCGTAHAATLAFNFH